MSRLTDTLYAQWLRANGSGMPSRAAAGARARGYGAQPHGRAIPRDVPGDQGAVSPARPQPASARGLIFPALAVPEHSPALSPRGAADNASPALPARHEKQGSRVSDYVDNS